MIHPRISRRGIAPAFSLVEVLFAVFILALGLLGLGAMIPAVVREQRSAADAAYGVAVANDAEAYLRSRPDLNRKSDSLSGMGWGCWVTRGQGPKGWSRDFSWMPKWLLQKTGADADDEIGRTFNATTGRYRIQLENNAQGTPCFIRVADRLWPVGSPNPQFVWDFAARRLPNEPGLPERIQIAVFVRRLDPNIRIPPGKTLLDVLTQQVPQSQWKVPVSVTANDADKRRPRLDGDTTSGEYARPFRVAVIYDPATPSRLYIDTNPNNPNPVNPNNEKFSTLSWQLFSRPGQKLVDNLGNVYTVMAPNPALKTKQNPVGSDYWVSVEPPVESWVEATDTNITELDPFPAGFGNAQQYHDYVRRCSTLRHVILTPQIPAAVSVFTISVENPPTSPSGSGVGVISP